MSLVNESYVWGWRKPSRSGRCSENGYWRSEKGCSKQMLLLTTASRCTVTRLVQRLEQPLLTPMGGDIAAYLKFSNFDNIHVALRATVERILFGNNAAAIGIVYRDQYGQYHYIMLEPGGEVILCAGALGSLQLLLLRGIVNSCTTIHGTVYR